MMALVYHLFAPTAYGQLALAGLSDLSHADTSLKLFTIYAFIFILIGRKPPRVTGLSIDAKKAVRILLRLDGRWCRSEDRRGMPAPVRTSEFLNILPLS